MLESTGQDLAGSIKKYHAATIMVAPNMPIRNPIIMRIALTFSPIFPPFVSLTLRILCQPLAMPFIQRLSGHDHRSEHLLATDTRTAACNLKDCSTYQT